MNGLQLDLGCGPVPAEGYLGIELPPDDGDPPPGELPLLVPLRPGVAGFDLGTGFPWPFDDGSIAALRSEHLIEHLPLGSVVAYDWQDGRLVRVGRRDVLFRFMDEAWRVAKEGAEFLLRWPSLVDASLGTLCQTAFQDPTHCRFIPESTIPYFSRIGRHVNGLDHYPYRCNWRIERLLQRYKGDGVTTLRVVESEALLVKEP